MDRNTILAQYQKLEKDFIALIPARAFSAEADMRLERIAHLVKLLGNPHHSFASIHITGTSGKGSTATMIASILAAAGYKTGLFLSPQLQIMNECYQINNRMVATSRLAAIYETIKPAINQVAKENPFGQPSNFEAQVALAFCLFQQEQVDVAVIEVGLGGAFDATNVLQAQVAVLTSIGLDHTDILGETIEKIAQAKAGIIKPGQIVVSGLTQPSTQQMTAERCAAQGATLWQAGQAFSYHIEETNENFKVVFPDKTYAGLRLKLQGGFQIRNASCAVAAVHAFTNLVSAVVVRAGLKQAVIPGRMECVQQNPTVLLDGAHNPDKLLAASVAIEKTYADKRRIVVLALKSDKPYRDLLPCVLAKASILIVTAFRVNERWQPIEPELLAQTAADLVPGLDIRVEAEPIAAIKQALAAANPEDLVWVTGSLYLVGNIREYWHSSADLIVQVEQAEDTK